MTQEEKLLLLQDLCARLPYGMKYQDRIEGGIHILTLGTISHYERFIPYLRPLSSMTEEEKKELSKKYVWNIWTGQIQIRYHSQGCWDDETECPTEEYIILFDWLNAHHFDYKGLIKRGLALEAPKDMYTMIIKPNKIKVNVWQMGYTTFKDYVNWNRQNAKCVNKGYVLLDNLDDCWDETVWHLLNWSCWNTDDKGNAIKPESVQSPLDHCNSDVILNIDGTNIYKYAMSVGFGEADSLEGAIEKITNECNFWPFPEVKRTSGATRHKDGKAYQLINDEWIEITW